MSFVQEFAFALRALRRRPGFAFAAVSSLALGIGANAATFSMVNTVMGAPLPYPRPNELVAIGRRGDGSSTVYSWSYARYRDLKQANRAFSGLAAFVERELPRTDGDVVEQLILEAVSEEYFATLGTAPSLGGEAFSDADRTVALVSYSVWRTRFGGEPGVVGRTIGINQIPVEIVGVLPEGFRGQSGRVDIWIPAASLPILTGSADELSEFFWQFRVVGRLREGVPVDDASRLARAMDAELNGGVASGSAGRRVEIRIVPLRDTMVNPRLRTALVLLTVAAACVLLTTCVNVATLLLLRIQKARFDVAIRTALGASSVQLARLFVVESLALAILGTAVALPLASWCTDVLWALRPVADAGAWGRSLALAPAPRLDARVLLVTIASALVAGVGCAIVPVSLMWRSLSGTGLNVRGGTGGPVSAFGGALGMGPRGWLASLQVAGAVTLVISAGLLVMSTLRLQRTDLGFRSRGVLAMRVDLPEARYSASAATSVLTALLDRMTALPGVEAATVDVGAPLASRIPETSMTVSALAPLGQGGRGTQVGFHSVGPDHFRVLGIPIVAGRPLDRTDFAPGSPPVVVLSKAAAEQFWADRNPVGTEIESLLFLGLGTSWKSAKIVGVAGDVRYGGAETDLDPHVYAPFAIAPPSRVTVMVRSKNDPALLREAARAAVREVDPLLPVLEMTTLDEVVRESTARPRFNAVLVSLYGTIAMMLAVLGIYSVLAVEATQRTQEIGIRMAIGASPGQVLALMLGSGLRLVLVGLAIGIPGAIMAGRLLSAQLYDVTALDPQVYGGVAVLFIGVALIASLGPALRASAVDPAVALRAE